MILPSLILVGRPNTGKSTIFNRVTKSRNALVSEEVGVTRDRKYGISKGFAKDFILIDVGGIFEEKALLDDNKNYATIQASMQGESKERQLQILMEKQVDSGIKEADAVLFVVNGAEGVTYKDEIILSYLRKYNKRIYLLINKVEKVRLLEIQDQFFALGLKDIFFISALHGDGFKDCFNLISKLENELSLKSIRQDRFGDDLNNLVLQQELYQIKDAVKISIIGRPNVGKSTLINAFLNKEQLVTFDAPGTTRDSIALKFLYKKKDYVLIDTAGIRRSKNITAKLEKFSLVKALESMNASNVVFLLIDASEGVVEQDISLLGLAANQGKGLVVLVNKSDLLSNSDKDRLSYELERKLQFAPFVEIHYISALKSKNLTKLLDLAHKIYKISFTRISTSILNKILHDALRAHSPPKVANRAPTLKYVHLGGLNPPFIVIHGKGVNKISDSYTRYLANFFAKECDWLGVPVKVEYRLNANPFVVKDLRKRNK